MMGIAWNILCGGIVLCTMTVIGCSPQDREAVEVARESMQRQAEQNKILSEQSQKNTQAADNFVRAEATARQELIAVQRQIVERDAQGRQELNQLQKDVQKSTSAAQEHVDTERTRLETERREIAQERQQAPIVAEATRGTGLLLVCVLPLAVVIHLIYSLRSRPDQDDVLTEILLQDLAAEEPAEEPRLFGYRTPAMMAPEDNTRVEGLPGPQADAE